MLYAYHTDVHSSTSVSSFVFMFSRQPWSTQFEPQLASLTKVTCKNCLNCRISLQQTWLKLQYIREWDRTKTRNGLGNGSKNQLSKLKICSPSGYGKSFHGCGLTSALVTASFSSNASVREHYRQTKSDRSKLVLFPGICPGLCLVKKVIPVILSTALSRST